MMYMVMLYVHMMYMVMYMDAAEPCGIHVHVYMCTYTCARIHVHVYMRIVYQHQEEFAHAILRACD